MTKPGFEIASIRSEVDAVDEHRVIFGRDCPQFAVRTLSGGVLHVLVNHFKSQSSGGGDRRRQAQEVRRIVDRLTAPGQHVMVLGDLNEVQPDPTRPAPNLTALFDLGGPLACCYELPGFEVGPRPGTFDSRGSKQSTGLRPALDQPAPAVTAGGVGTGAVREGCAPASAM
jgi:hypothetical protein